MSVLERGRERLSEIEISTGDFKGAMCRDKTRPLKELNADN